MYQPSEKDEKNVGRALILAAYDIFLECEAKEDFGIQAIGPTTVVFGGVNRVIWGPKNGFVADRSYCTKRFLKHFDARE